MRQPTIEWNMAYSQEEVCAGLEKLLTTGKYPYTQISTAEGTQFRATLPQGFLELTVHPLTSQPSQFNPPIVFPRTALIVTCIGASPHDEATFMRRLTLTFLRGGG